MQWLLIDLHAPLASFGGAAPGTIRDTERIPTRSALLGLCAAALGIRREDTAAHANLDAALGFASRCYDPVDSYVLRDYHTAQVPKQAALNHSPHRTRKDELQVAKTSLSTVLSDRYYLQELHCTVGITVQDDAQGIRLEALAQALRQPRFTLYLGRKSCAVHWPLNPRLQQADDWLLALQADQTQRGQHLATFKAHCKDGMFLPGQPSRQHVTYAWDTRLPCPAQLDAQQRSQLRHVQRRDAPISRSQWRYGARTEVQWSPSGATA